MVLGYFTHDGNRSEQRIPLTQSLQCVERVLVVSFYHLGPQFRACIRRFRTRNLIHNEV